MKEFHGYKADDGTVFETKEECLRHESIAPILKLKERILGLEFCYNYDKRPHYRRISFPTTTRSAEKEYKENLDNMRKHLKTLRTKHRHMDEWLKWWIMAGRLAAYVDSSRRTRNSTVARFNKERAERNKLMAELIQLCRKMTAAGNPITAHEVLRRNWFPARKEDNDGKKEKDAN